MSRFYVRPDARRGDKLYIDGDEAHHILDVMRLKKGDQVIAFDGTGDEHSGIIEEVGKNSLEVKILETRPRGEGRGYTITLAQSVPKKDVMDYIVQKTTELGIDAVIPMVTRRTIVRIKREKAGLKTKRWDDIAREAAKQCGRTTVPAIEDSLTFEKVMDRVKDYDIVLMPAVEDVKRASVTDALSDFKGKSILILIGPEGGFDKTEIERAGEKKVRFVTLGNNTLRCDTAAIAAIAMVNAVLETGVGNGRDRSLQ